MADERIEVAALPDVVRHVERVAERLAGWPEAASCYRTWVASATRGQVVRLDEGGIHLITGDIPAMWLRDSSAQVRGLWPVVEEEPDGPFAAVVAGLIRRQVTCLALDPYANSFTRGETTHHRFDRPRPHRLVWERKWELDSVAYSVDLWVRWWDATGDAAPLGAEARAVVDTILGLLHDEQDPDARSRYSFRRPFATLPRGGRGPRVSPCGLVRSAFRPSDDPCHLGFHIPGNAHLVVALRGLGRVASDVWDDADLVGELAALADTVDDAIGREAVGDDDVLAYEVDGAGGRLFMDDANVPSLLSLPYLGWRGHDDPVVVATRAAVLSPRNPWWVDGSVVRGIGSPHTGRGRVWPMAVAVEGLSAPDAGEARAALERLVALAEHLPERRLVESVDAGRPARLTRPWFGWPNALAAELAEVVSRTL
ncbi:MAG: glycoside hydrolase family 125 protein [Acidimicrobiia bacterium]|nr:glycoside hydrolase family 125 protein [Acidimicrobiia bacterium]